MAVSEIRTQIYLERRQHEALKRVAARRSVSMAAVVREAIAAYLDESSRRSRPADRRDPAWTLMERVGEIGGSGHRDGSLRVEEDLYGPIEP